MSSASLPEERGAVFAMGPKCVLIGARAGRYAKFNDQLLMRWTGGAHYNDQELPWELSRPLGGRWLGPPPEKWTLTAMGVERVRRETNAMGLLTPVSPKRNERVRRETNAVECYGITVFPRSCDARGRKSTWKGRLLLWGSAPLQQKASIVGCRLRRPVNFGAPRPSLLSEGRQKPSKCNRPLNSAPHSSRSGGRTLRRQRTGWQCHSTPPGRLFYGGPLTCNRRNLPFH